MEHLISNFLIGMIIVYAVLGFIIYHKIFSVIYFNTFKGLMGELFGCAIFGLIMAMLTVHFWKIVCIGIIIVGIILVITADSGTKRVFIIVIAVLLVIFLFNAGKVTQSGDKANTAKTSSNNSMRTYSEDKDLTLINKYFYGEWNKNTEDGATAQIASQGFDGKPFAFDQIKIYNAKKGHFDLTMYSESTEDTTYNEYLLKIADGKMKIYEYKDKKNKNAKSYLGTWTQIRNINSSSEVNSISDTSTQGME